MDSSFFSSINMNGTNNNSCREKFFRAGLAPLNINDPSSRTSSFADVFSPALFTGQTSASSPYQGNVFVFPDGYSGLGMGYLDGMSAVSSPSGLHGPYPSPLYSRSFSGHTSAVNSPRFQTSDFRSYTDQEEKERNAYNEECFLFGPEATSSVSGSTKGSLLARGIIKEQPISSTSFNRCNGQNEMRKEDDHGRAFFDSDYTGPFGSSNESPKFKCQNDCVFQQFSGLAVRGPALEVSPSYSKKVFIGGVPAGTDQEVLHANFSKFGVCQIDWPKKSTGDVIPPEGYIFVVFDNAEAVNSLLKLCVLKDDRFFFQLLKSNGCFHPVEVKAWEIHNATYTGNHGWRRFRAQSVFVGGIPRTTTAVALVKLIEAKIGSVAYCNIEHDTYTHYPKGAAQVVFHDQESFFKAIAVRKLCLQFAEGERKVEMKAFLESNMPCVGCRTKANTKFCTDLLCLKYYCDVCWTETHSSAELRCHGALKKMRGRKMV